MSDQIIKVGVTAFVTNNNGQILLGKKKRAFDPTLVGYWVTPGGRVNFKEKLNDAIVREVKEETGIDIEINGLLYASQIICEQATGPVHYVFVAFVAESMDDDQPIVAGDDLSEARWFDEKEVKAMFKDLTPFSQEVVTSALEF